MLKPLWFLIKLILVVYALTWISARPGDITINWNGYIIEASFGFVLSVILGIIILSAVLYNGWRTLVRVPKIMRQYHIVQSQNRGYDALTKGLAAIAAGDPKLAEKHSKRAQKLIPDAPLTQLLTAQNALLHGNKATAESAFEALLEDKNAVFFGLRGLMNEALKSGDYRRALPLLKKAERLHPKRSWIIEHLFAAETRTAQWQSAKATLKKAARLNLFDIVKTTRHRQALLLAEAYDFRTQGLDSQAIRLAKKAYNLGADYLPSSLFYAELLVQKSRKRQAVKVIESAWSHHPHPDFIALWTKLAPLPRGRTPEDKAKNNLAWFKRLHRLSPQHHLSHYIVGKAAMDHGLYTEARDWLKSAEAYKDLARLEQLDGRHNIQSREWLERATEARPLPTWLCQNCGHHAISWAPLCTHCHDFNTIEWQSPDEARSNIPTKTTPLSLSVLEI